MLEFHKVEINRSETSLLLAEVPAWEIPVLVAVNGDDRCKPAGTFPVARDIPDAADEFSRLGLKYGADNDSGQEYVALVYGIGQRGIEALAAAIEKEVRDAPPVVDSAKLFAIPDPTDELFTDLPEMAKGARAISE